MGLDTKNKSTHRDRDIIHGNIGIHQLTGVDLRKRRLEAELWVYKDFLKLLDGIMVIGIIDLTRVHRIDDAFSLHLVVRFSLVFSNDPTH